MPPKKPLPKASKSKDLVTVGPRGLVEATSRLKRDGLKEQRPTTSRALVLRNQKYELAPHDDSKITGREKLDLLAEDLVKQTTTSIGNPFSLEACAKISESQFASYLDDIASLKDPDLFQGLIEEELKARSLQEGKSDEAIREPAFIAQTIAARVHNAYLLAAAWRIVADSIYSFQHEEAVTDQNIKEKMTQKSFLQKYLCLYDMTNLIVALTQLKFATLATTSPHYAKYFKRYSDDDSEKMTFDTKGIREACKSFVDSIIIELCFPQDSRSYPKAILLRILREAVDEAPREGKRFPQPLWDTVGDLSECVLLQEMVEAPLLGPSETKYKETPRELPKAYKEWNKAEVLSDQAMDKSDKLERLVSPLTKVSNRSALDNVWTQIDLNYKGASNKTPDQLWGLADALGSIKPRWTYSFVPRRKGVADDSDAEDSDDDGPGPRKITGVHGKKKPLTITDGYGTDDSMPPLQDVSESDESGDDDFSDTDVSDDESENESDYDEEQEDELRELLKEAMDTAVEADWFNTEKNEQTGDPLEDDDKKSNPFLKLLGSLRGRMFNSNPKLSPRDRAPKKASKKPDAGPNGTTAGPTGSTKTTVEEVSDEEEGGGKKKKKKNNKKKKKSAIHPPKPPAPAPAPAAAPTLPTSLPKTAPKPAASVGQHSVGSSVSLPPVEQTQAQSGRAYAANLEVKQKVKSRGDTPSIFSGKGVLSRFGVGKEPEEVETKSQRKSWFGAIGKKSKGYLHQILNTSEDVTKGSAGMKWDTFVKVMTDMGFKHVPSTAGSSVRFDPPSGMDRAIMFHKPHPDSFIHPKKLKDFSKKLRKYYGWTPDDLEGF